MTMILSLFVLGVVLLALDLFVPGILLSVGGVIAFLIATVAGTAMAWQAWRTTSNAGAADESRQRRHFLAGLATGSGALSALVIAAMWAPTWVVSACVR